MKSILCHLFGHPLYSLMWVSERCEKVRCRRCDRLFAVHHEMQVILPWDSEFDEVYRRWGTLG